MNITLFGQHVKLINIIIILVLGIIIGGTMLCSCSPSGIEAFSLNASAPISYKMGTNVPQSWENADSNNGGWSQWSQSLTTNQAGQVPLPEDELLFFYNNKFSPSCCLDPGSSYSNSLGCACKTAEQAKYLSQRGGNRTLKTIF